MFEVYAMDTINKVSNLFNIRGGFLGFGTFDSKDNYYILGIGKYNIYNEGISKGEIFIAINLNNKIIS